MAVIPKLDFEWDLKKKLSAEAQTSQAMAPTSSLVAEEGNGTRLE